MKDATLQTSPSISARSVAVLIGVGLACIVSSRVALTVPLVLAALCYPLMGERRLCWARFVDATRSSYGVIVIIIIVAWLPNVLVSLAPMKSLESALRSGLFIGLATLLWSAIAHEERLYFLTLRSFVGALAILLGAALFGHFVLPEVYALIRGMGWTVVNTKGLLKGTASAAALFIPVLLFVSVLFTRWWRAVALLLVIGCVVLVWSTGSRSALAGLIAGILASMFFYVLFRVRRSALLPCIAIFLGLTAGVVFGLSKTLPVNLPSQNKHVNVEELPLPLSLVDWHRQTIWQYVWSEGADHRLFGSGVNAIDKLPASHKKIGASNTYFVPLHPHNWIVEISVETGIVGVSALIFGILFFVYKQARRFRANGDAAIWP